MTDFTKKTLEVLRPFGPTIAKVKMPQDLVNKLNEYTENVLSDQKKQDKLNYGDKLAGNVKQEFVIEPEYAKKIGWGNFLAEGVSDWVFETSKRKITKFNIIESWIVRQFKNEYNPTHWHSGHISGVGYLKVPKTLGSTRQNNKSVNNNGKLEMIHGSKAFLCRPCFRVTPKVGEFYFFPNYLMHTVYPFSGSDEERRSVSFNANVDHDIFSE